MSKDNFAQREELEKTLWSNSQLTDASNLLGEDWAAYGSGKTKEDQAIFRSKALSRANILLDFSTSYQQAIDVYKILLERDQAKADDLAMGADLNNIGLSYQLFGLTTVDSTTQSAYFKNAMANYKQAESHFRKIRNEDALFTNLANQYALLHDMHNKKEACETFSKLKEVDKQPNRDFRELVLEQQ